MIALESQTQNFDLPLGPSSWSSCSFPLEGAASSWQLQEASLLFWHSPSFFYCFQTPGSVLDSQGSPQAPRYCQSCRVYHDIIELTGK